MFILALNKSIMAQVIDQHSSISWGHGMEIPYIDRSTEIPRRRWQD